MLVILVNFPNHFRPVPSSRRACFVHFKSDFLSHGVLEDKSHHVRGFHYDLYPTNSQADFMHLSSRWMCFQSSSQASQMETEAMDVQQQDGGQDSPVHTTQPQATGKPFSEALSSQWHFSSSQWVRCDLFTSCFFTTSFDISSCLFCEVLSWCSAVAQCLACGLECDALCCCGEAAGGGLACCAEDSCSALLDCGILEDCCQSSDCLEICLECCSICFPASWTVGWRGAGKAVFIVQMCQVASTGSGGSD